MDRLFEESFNPNNKFHVKWLKDLVNNVDGVLIHNPFGIQVNEKDSYIYTDVVSKLSRKFINSSVCYNFGDLFTYEYAYHNDGEYQKCRLLKCIDNFPKGMYFEYALVYPRFIDFYTQDDDEKPSLTVQRY